MGSYFLQQSIISARFMTTFGHFIALLVLFSTIDNNISVALADNYTVSERKEAVDTAWVSFQSLHHIYSDDVFSCHPSSTFRRL